MGYFAASTGNFLPAFRHTLWGSHSQVFFGLLIPEDLVFYMFRTSYVYHQEDSIVHAAFYAMFSTCLCNHSTRLKDMLDM